MIKIMLFSKRKPGLTMEEFRSHYRQVHLPLALRCMPKIARYHLNFIDEALGWDPDLDCVVEIWFALDPPWSVARLGVTDSAGQAALAADEENFLDRARTRISVVDEYQGFP